MNEFYHEVVFSFNTWYLVCPAMIVAMILLGMTTFGIDMETLKIYAKENEIPLKLMAVFLDILIHVLIIAESGRGITQVLTNHMDNPAYLIIVAPIALFVTIVVTGYLFYLSTKIGKWIRLGYLVEIYQKLKAERDEQRKKEGRFRMVTLSKEDDDNLIEFYDRREVKLM